jgi:hypothetical protein
MVRSQRLRAGTRTGSPAVTLERCRPMWETSVKSNRTALSDMSALESSREPCTAVPCPTVELRNPKLREGSGQLVHAGHVADVKRTASSA